MTDQHAVIVHISDLHFGHHKPELVAPLLESVKRCRPHLVVVSGDLVEHAAESEFQEARAFLDQLPEPRLVIPGNHDLAFYNPMRRFRIGLKLFRKYGEREVRPVFRGSSMVAVGLNTARKWPFKGGRVNLKQLGFALGEMQKASERTLRILVTHHPLDLPANFHRSDLVGRAGRAMAQIAHDADILLAGHLHLSSVGPTAERYARSGYSLIYAQAGTAISKRDKGEANSFNVIRWEADLVRLQRYTWDGRCAFAEAACDEFRLGEKGWVQIKVDTITTDAETIEPRR